MFAFYFSNFKQNKINTQDEFKEKNIYPHRETPTYLSEKKRQLKKKEVIFYDSHFIQILDQIEIFLSMYCVV